MTAFKVGDKVLHPLMGDNVMEVSHEYGGGRMYQARYATRDATVLLTAPASEFVPYTPPRVSTEEVRRRFIETVDAWNRTRSYSEAELAATQALAEAATALAERLEEETR